MRELIGLRPPRRQLLAGMLSGLGALGASMFAPWILRPARATSGNGDGPLLEAAAQRDADKADAPPQAALYEEDRRDPKRRKSSGAVQWALVETGNYSENLLETSLHASVAIPERSLALKWRLERNRDKTLPASHIVVFQFTLAPDSPRDIDRVSGLLMKSSPQARGVPFAGLGVKVTKGFFLFGLSDKDDAEAANLVLLKTSEWFDVPIVYSDGHHATLAFQKGEPGRRMLAQAFAAWDGPRRPAPPFQARPTIK